MLLTAWQREVHLSELHPPDLIVKELSTISSLMLTPALLAAASALPERERERERECERVRVRDRDRDERGSERARDGEGRREGGREIEI